jgi:nitroimidazol reductase NimA-like FMN-containing flavoprotein (pyridoxamine 5'-phosphate oxidase superfamily)
MTIHSEREPRDATALVGTTPVPWTTVRDRLADPEPESTHWLATTAADGRPHLMPLIGIWRDGAFYFIAGAGTRKARNLAANSRCAIGTSTRTNPSLDVIVEGVATAVTDPAEVRHLAETYRSVLGWPLEARDDGLHGPNAPTAGPPPYTLFRVTPITAFGLPGVAGMSEVDPDERHTPTRWRFEHTSEHTPPQ